MTAALAASCRVQHVYLFLLLLHTLAASPIWGVNTLFLLDTGLSAAQAFGASDPPTPVERQVLSSS